MPKDTTFLLAVKIKLGLIALLFILTHLVSPFLINCYLFHYHRVVPWLTAVLPIITLAICLPLNMYFSNLRDKITDVKYNKIFPIKFKYELSEPFPKTCRFDKVKDVADMLLPGDVILRRYDTYLDGLIFGQATYFTHIAIYMGNGVVMDAVGKEGVSRRKIADFAMCDDIAVVRFNANDAVIKKWLSKKHTTDPDVYTEKKLSLIVNNEATVSRKWDGKKIKDKNYEPLCEIKKAINKDITYTNPDIGLTRLVALENRLGLKEQKIFDQLQLDSQKKETSITPTEVHAIITEVHTFINDVAIKLPNCYEGRQYDFDFNFNDDDKLSCVEFVWDCYKALFPLHRIRRKVYRFFGIIFTRILVPDMFLASDFFQLEYNSYHPQFNSSIDAKDKLQNAKNLYKAVTKKRASFFCFTIQIVVCQMLFLVLFYLIEHLFVFLNNYSNCHCFAR